MGIEIIILVVLIKTLCRVFGSGPRKKEEGE